MNRYSRFVVTCNREKIYVTNIQKLKASSKPLSGAVHSASSSPPACRCPLDIGCLHIAAAGRPDATSARGLRHETPAVDGISPHLLRHFKSACVLFASTRPGSKEGCGGHFARRQREAVSLGRRHIRSKILLRRP